MALVFEPLEKRSYINLSYNSLFEIEYKYFEAFTKSELRRLDAKSVALIKNVRLSISLPLLDNTERHRWFMPEGLLHPP
jgi:hypothetical protein